MFGDAENKYKGRKIMNNDFFCLIGKKYKKVRERIVSKKSYIYV